MLCLAAISITPYGTRLAMYPFTVASTLPVSVANILEWQVMPFNLVGGKIFLALVLGFFLLQMVFAFHGPSLRCLLFLGGVGMACLHVRFVLLFVPFFAPLFATMVARWNPGVRQEERPVPAEFRADGGNRDRNGALFSFPRGDGEESR